MSLVRIPYLLRLPYTAIVTRYRTSRIRHPLLGIPRIRKEARKTNRAARRLWRTMQRRGYLLEEEQKELKRLLVHSKVSPARRFIIKRLALRENEVVIITEWWSTDTKNRAEQ